MPIILAILVIGALSPAASHAFEPMPPIMRTLLEIVPEKNGWFVDEPLVAVPGTPDEARPLFECFRVIVPDLESLDKAIGRLTANAPKLPIKKITRYDREPGAPGLAGFRGIWCKTEDEALVGFAIVTVNQNRFLLWAKQGYYPSYATDSINAKVRDQYARDVSRYLAGVDAKVPDNEAPQATGRMLPEWMDLYPPPPDHARSKPETYNLRAVDSITSIMARAAEIRAWGFQGIEALVPTASTLASIIDSAPDTLWPNREAYAIQDQFKGFFEGRYDVSGVPRPLDRETFNLLKRGPGYNFVMDRYGRVRFCESDNEQDEAKPFSLHFPGAWVLSTGAFQLEMVPDWGSTDPKRVGMLVINRNPYFWSLHSPLAVPPDSAVWLTEANLRSLGHFLRVLRQEQIPFEGLLIRKFWTFW
ncbi:MAG: hypothetical protein AB1792_08345 [Candidatus Zixiibacteriota bacterium]